MKTGTDYCDEPYILCENTYLGFQVGVFILFRTLNLLKPSRDLTQSSYDGSKVYQPKIICSLI